MTDAITLILAVVFLGAIPVNVYAAREVRRLAHMPPAIGILSLLSRLVDILAVVAVILALLSTASAVLLLTGVRILPIPVAFVAFIIGLLMVSYGNFVVRRYLNRMRRPEVVE